MRGAIRFKAIAIALIFSSCTTTELASTYADLKLPTTLNEDANKGLTEKEVRQDIRQTIYALSTAYSGKLFLPGTQFSELIADIQKISEPMTAFQFCRRLEEPFFKVSDQHLLARFPHPPFRQCLPDQGERKPTVGSNYFHSKENFWDVQLSHQKGLKLLMISILSFPPPSDPRWDGFIEQVTELLPKSQAVILDLRGNQGGDDFMGDKLAALLEGQTPPSVKEPSWQLNTIEAMQVMENYPAAVIRRLKREGKSVPDHLLKQVTGFEKAKELARQGKLTHENFSALIHSLSGDQITKDSVGTFNPSMPAIRPTYILMDSATLSSGESTIDFFKGVLGAKKVGENTAGYLHFGNVGMIILKNSGVLVQMGTSFSRYKDGKILEKIGISPDIPVPPGSDAFDYALADFQRAKK